MIRDMINIELTSIYEIDGVFVIAKTEEDAVRIYYSFFLFPSTHKINSVKLVSSRGIIEQK